MRVSCIIPFKNRRDFVLNAIASTQEGQGEAVEVVVVDDGSTDGAGEAIAARFPGVRQVRLQGVGPGLARNAGIAAATGDVLMLLDSDDCWLPGHVDRLLAVLAKGYQVAYGVTWTKDEIGGRDFLLPEDGCGIEGECFSALMRWCFLVPSAVAFTRDAFDATEGFGPGFLGEDWVFFLRLAAAFPFGFASGEPITLRRLHAGSLCAISGRQEIIDCLNRVQSTLMTLNRVVSDDIEGVGRMRRLVNEEGEKWRTIQDWYLAMKERGLLDNHSCPRKSTNGS